MTEFRPTRFEILPLIIKNLLIINVLVYIAQMTFGASGFISLEDTFALHHVQSPLFKPWQIITHMFMHAGPNSGGDWYWHILSNMFALFMFGGPIERVMGAKRFLNYYLLCGLGAAALQMAVSYGETQVTVAELQEMGITTEEVKRMVVASHISMDDANAIMHEIVRRNVLAPRM